MIKFFRKIRQQMIKENKVTKYLLYAIGEIVLVVIGILIALQINLWQEQKKDKKLEKRYLTNLVQELKKDSVALTSNFKKLSEQARTKNTLINMLKKGKKQDSLLFFFELQWRPIYPYSPSKSTYQEITNSSHLSIIQSEKIRSGIVRLYNSYENLTKDEDFLMQYFKNLVTILTQNISDIYLPDINEVIALGKKPYVLNNIRLNGAFTRKNNYQEKLKECTALLLDIRNYLASK